MQTPEDSRQDLVATDDCCPVAGLTATANTGNILLLPNYVEGNYAFDWLTRRGSPLAESRQTSPV